MLAKKENKTKNTVASSHLICPQAEGQKYQAALKWSLPVVSKDWLLACLRDHTWVSERPFLVGECQTFNEDKPLPREEVEAVPADDDTVITEAAQEEDQDVTMENTKLEVSQPMEVEEKEDGDNSDDEITVGLQVAPSCDPSTPAVSKTLRKSVDTPGELSLCSQSLNSLCYSYFPLSFPQNG